MTRSKKNLSKEEKLEKKRVAERLRYEEIKNDPVRLAVQKEKNKLKYLRRKEKGQRKLVSEMSDREKRQVRKKWRIHSNKYYSKQRRTEETTADSTRASTSSSLSDAVVNARLTQHEELPTRQIITPRLLAARERSNRQRRKRNLELKEKNKTIAKLKARVNKYKKRYHRLEKRQVQSPQEISPETKMKKLAEDPKTRIDVVKKAVFGETLEQQITENIKNLKTMNEKKIANKILLGSIVKQNKVWQFKNKIITYKKTWYQTQQKSKKITKKDLKNMKNRVQQFLEDDKYSRLCSGKKEFITRKKIKKQKRYLMDTMRNLHKEFLKTGNVISYSLFTRLRPFWIVAPKIIDRDTCMCATHSNIELVVDALSKGQILKVSSYQNLLLSLCCDRYNEGCLKRTCNNCSTKTIKFSEEYDETILIKYKQWVSSKETFIDPKTKKKKAVVKQKKEAIETTARELIVKLENDLVKVFEHEMNIIHQYQSIKILKESLTEKDAVIHMDFSENFSTKYSKEIQAFHFGGSRTQLSLHTVVVYLKGSTRSYCTVSSNLSHNVPAIWAHLKPVLEELPANIENLNFLSDGPVTQYRNKLMFYVLACKIPSLCPEIIQWTWNYHEAGHGKGAPDGVGAVCKRTADNVVACGGDISNLTEFCAAIQSRCPNVTLFVVTNSEIDDMSRFILEDQPKLIPFKGTLKVHQVEGNVFLPRKLVMKSLSCFCDIDSCSHYRLGLLQYSLTSHLSVDDVFEDTDSNRSETEILNVIDMKNVSSSFSNLSLNEENSEDLADKSKLDIDSVVLFPDKVMAGSSKNDKLKKSENDKLAMIQTRKRKMGERDSLQGKKPIRNEKNKNEKVRKSQKKKRCTRGKKKRLTKGKDKNDDNEADDCFCLICGTLYSEDTTGNDWIQCIICHEWAQLQCIKSDPQSFTCPDCSSDSC